MEYLVSVLIISLCLYLILHPFFNRKPNWQMEVMEDDLDRISLEQIYATLNEAEMEFNMGKLPKADYDSLKTEYEILAKQKLKEDALNSK